MSLTTTWYYLSYVQNKGYFDLKLQNQSSCYRVIVFTNIKQIPNSFCAEILNYDLEYATYNDYLIINQYLLQYKILIFRNQSSLTIEKQREFSLYFGKLQSHIETISHHPNYNDVNIISNIKKDNGQPIGLYVNVDKYHTDY